jgi:RNA polymerase sigma factor (sigma-70 family)
MTPPTVSTSTADLLGLAAQGNECAWSELVDRYGQLVWSVVRGYRLDAASAADVTQTVWLRLVEHCDRIRDPERLPGWLARTAQNEALRVLRQQQRVRPTELYDDIVDEAASAYDERLIADERQRAVLHALAELPDGCQELLRLLATDPPLDYSTIADLLGRPIGSIGPTRQRCLGKLRIAVERYETDTGEGGPQ